MATRSSRRSAASGSAADGCRPGAGRRGVRVQPRGRAAGQRPRRGRRPVPGSWSSAPPAGRMSRPTSAELSAIAAGSGHAGRRRLHVQRRGRAVHRRRRGGGAPVRPVRRRTTRTSSSGIAGPSPTGRPAPRSAIAERMLPHLEHKRRARLAEGQGAPDPETLEVVSLRAGASPGMHVVGFDAPGESIELRVTARDRSAYVAGALLAADTLLADPDHVPGVTTFEQLLTDLTTTDTTDRSTTDEPDRPTRPAPPSPPGRLHRPRDALPPGRRARRGRLHPPRRAPARPGHRRPRARAARPASRPRRPTRRTTGSSA